MYLSKSKYCKAVQCYKMLWLDKNKSEEGVSVDNSSVLDNGTVVGELAKDLFGFHFDVSYNEDLNMMIKDTESLLFNKDVVITEASFKYENNFCSVDILVKHDNNYEIYEVKSSTSVEEIYIHDVAYQTWLLRQKGLNVVKSSIVYLNNKYVRDGELDLKELFAIKDVTDKVDTMMDEIEKRVTEVNKYVDNDLEQVQDIGLHCYDPYRKHDKKICPFFKYCSGDLENSVFDLSGMSFAKKVKLYKEGIINYKDLLKSDIKDSYKMQIEYDLNPNKEPYVELDKIKKFMNTLTYPLYFLDFETYQQSIPLYDGISPYNQIPFQYSLHYYEEKGGNLHHKEFLAKEGEDPRRSLAERLVNDIPKDVCTLAYNMGFEKGVIKNLAKLFPDLSEHLMNIHDNIKDLMIPFQSKWYYISAFHGSYSIKYVLPGLFPNDPSLDYHNLEDIHNGGEAMNSYAALVDMEKEEVEKIRHSLLKYCELDTFAMVKIYNYLEELVNK